MPPASLDAFGHSLVRPPPPSTWPRGRQSTWACAASFRFRLDEFLHDFFSWPPVVMRVVLDTRPEENAAISPRVQHDTFGDGIALLADHDGVVNDPERRRGRDGPVHCQSVEVLLSQALREIFGPVIAEASFTKTVVNLGIVDEWRVGNAVFPGKLQGIEVGDARGALGFPAIDARPKLTDLDGQFVTPSCPTFGFGAQPPIIETTIATSRDARILVIPSPSGFCTRLQGFSSRRQHLRTHSAMSDRVILGALGRSKALGNGSRRTSCRAKTAHQSTVIFLRFPLLRGAPADPRHDRLSADARLHGRIDQFLALDNGPPLPSARTGNRSLPSTHGSWRARSACRSPVPAAPSGYRRIPRSRP